MMGLAFLILADGMRPRRTENPYERREPKREQD